MPTKKTAAEIIGELPMKTSAGPLSRNTLLKDADNPTSILFACRDEISHLRCSVAMLAAAAVSEFHEVQDVRTGVDLFAEHICDRLAAVDSLLGIVRDALHAAAE